LERCCAATLDEEQLLESLLIPLLLLFTLFLVIVNVEESKEFG